jgi:hypothetical protein
MDAPNFSKITAKFESGNCKILYSKNAFLKMKEFYEVADDIERRFGCEMMAKGKISKKGENIVIEDLVLPERVMAVRKLGKVGLYDTGKREVCGSGVHGSHEFYEWSDDWDIATGSLNIIESSKYLERTKDCNFLIHSHPDTEVPSREDCLYCISNGIEFLSIRTKGKTYFYRIKGKGESDEKAEYSLICIL